MLPHAATDHVGSKCNSCCIKTLSHTWLDHVVYESASLKHLVDFAGQLEAQLVGGFQKQTKKAVEVTTPHKKLALAD